MRIFKSEKGQSMVEFAIAFVFLLFFLMGIFEFSWLMGNKLLATHASREGARYAAVHVDESGWINNAKTVAANALVINASSYPGYTVNVTKKTDASLGDSVEVSISYNVPHLTGFIPSSVVSNPFPINAKTVMKQE